MHSSAVIAIVGRPNVGKSSLFNRLIGKRQSIIAKEAGTTRDRIFQVWEISGYETTLVDTGGLEYGKKENIESDIQSQALIAIREADLIIFVTDSREDLTVDDFTAADILRKSGKPTMLIANKCDQFDKLENPVTSIYELGFGDAINISAIHDLGIDQLKTEIEKTLKKLKFRKKSLKKPIEKNETKITIVGRPNAGKSSLVNAFLGAEKIIVSDIPGTTRDRTDSDIIYNEKHYTLIDTAGLRRPGKIEGGIEKFSMLRALTAIDESEIVILLIDGNANISHQDCHIAQMALEKKKGLILAINKLDLIKKTEDQREYLTRKMIRKFSFVPWAPLVFVSAKDKKNIYKLLELSDSIMEERKKRIPTAELNSFLQKTCYKHLPASAKMIKPKFFYGSQVETNPPTFVMFFRHPENMHFSYPRYLENEIRAEYGFTGTPIDIRIKNKSQD
jgi:GTP-binding protein